LQWIIALKIVRYFAESSMGLGNFGKILNENEIGRIRVILKYSMGFIAIIS
jgi:hypothetical protein